MRSSRLLVPVVLLALVTAGCSGAPSSPATSTPAPAPAEVAVTTQAAPAAQDVASSASGWFAGAEVTLTRASFDPSTGKATVAATARNTSNHDLEILDDVFLDLGDGSAHLPLAGIGPTAIKGSTTAVAFVFAVPSGVAPDLAKSVLQLGDVDQQRWLLPLAPGASGDGIAPRTQALSDSFTATGFAFRITRVDVVPWGCDRVHTEGDVATTDYAPIPKGRLGLLVWLTYTEQADIRGGDTIEEVSIVQPDGLAARADPRTSVQDHGDRVEDIPWCITADEPVAGKYVVRWTTYASGSGSRTVTVG